MTDLIGQTFRSNAGWDLLTDLVDLEDRMAGTEGERRGAELTRDALMEAGARNTRLEEFPIQGWERGSSEIHAGNTVQDCISLPRSPSDDATGELVDLGYGLPEDFEESDIKGNVVMTRSDVPDHFDRYIHRREKYYYAVSGSAAAFVYRNHVEGCLPPTGSVGTEEDPIGDIPAVGVSSEVGARLARRFDGSELTVSVDAAIAEATSQNVHAEMGPETNEVIFVMGHVDAHDIAEGAADNGAGTAMVIEIANALAERDLETRVEFVVYGAEEVGLVGSEHHAANADFDSIKAIVNNDGVVRGRTLEFFTHGFPELDAAVESVADRFSHPVQTIPRMGPHSDHWPFVKWGVPGYHVMSDTGEQGRGWGHTFADTLDKVDIRDLREQAVVLTELVFDLGRESRAIAHRSPDEIATVLEDEDQAAGMKVIGDWPYDDTV
jgi:Zn-dependent M28 family amino/carboxypeptidase